MTNSKFEPRNSKKPQKEKIQNVIKSHISGFQYKFRFGFIDNGGLKWR